MNNIFTWIATIIALTGTVLNCKKIRYCFYLWIITNTMWLVWDLYTGLYSRAILDLFQLALAVYGLLEWKKSID